MIVVDMSKKIFERFYFALNHFLYSWGFATVNYFLLFCYWVLQRWTVFYCFVIEFCNEQLCSIILLNIGYCNNQLCFIILLLGFVTTNCVLLFCYWVFVMTTVFYYFIIVFCNDQLCFIILLLVIATINCVLLFCYWVLQWPIVFYHFVIGITPKYYAQLVTKLVLTITPLGNKDSLDL